MKALVLVSLLAAVMFLVPVAVAQNPVVQVNLMRNDGAPNDAVVDIPESRRFNIPLKVGAHAEGFVCAQAAELSVEIQLQPYPDHWAGASINPGLAKITIPVGGPGTPPGADYDGVGVNGEPNLELFWGDDRPNLNAKETYRLTTTSTWINVAGCAPFVGPAQEGSMQLTGKMADIVVDTNDTSVPSDCAADPSLPQCQTSSVVPDGDSPTVQAFGLTVMLAGVAFVLRRRRE